MKSLILRMWTITIISLLTSNIVLRCWRFPFPRTCIRFGSCWFWACTRFRAFLYGLMIHKILLLLHVKAFTNTHHSLYKAQTSLTWCRYSASWKPRLVHFIFALCSSLNCWFLGNMPSLLSVGENMLWITWRILHTYYINIPCPIQWCTRNEQ